jgi:CheY-like chemotaxis protein
VVGDATRLRQILVNLLSNAVKFTNQGEVMVTVAATEKTVAENMPGNDPANGETLSLENGQSAGQSASPAQYELLFTVADTGIGIPTDKMHRLFQSFSQLDTSTTRKYGGTGLGLVISHRLCTLMDGRMWAESDGIAGHGTTFHFTIQVERADPDSIYLDALANAAEDSAPGTEGQGVGREGWPRLPKRGLAGEFRGKSILVVDDNASSRSVLLRQLAKWEIEAHGAASGAEAMSLLQQDGQRFDAALIDMHMPELDGPGLDGIELARRIRQLQPWRTLPLILLASIGATSVGAAANDLLQARSERGGDKAESGGADGYDLFSSVLTKPCKALHLADALHQLFGGDQPVDRPIPDTRQPAPANGEWRPLRILLAEDNVINQKVALLILRKLGYDADVVANGLEALDALQRQPYDLILMDIQMPEMDGLEATRQIRRCDAIAQQPRIVAMTANAMQGDRAVCLAAGMDDYISKPMRANDLLTILRNVPLR